MDHDAYMKQKYGIEQRDLSYLEPHEMNRKELKAAIPQRLKSISIMSEMLDRIYGKFLSDHKAELQLALKPKLKKGTNLYVFQKEEVQRLREVIEKDIRRIEVGKKMIEGYRDDVTKIRSLLEGPLKEVAGGMKTTPLKKICRVHLLDSETGRRMLRPGEKTLYRRSV